MGERCLLRGSRNRQSFIQIYFLVAALEHGFFGAADVYVYPISCMVTGHLSLPGIKGFCGTELSTKTCQVSGKLCRVVHTPRVGCLHTLHPTPWVESDWPRPNFLITGIGSGRDVIFIGLMWEVKDFCLTVWIREALLFRMVLCSYKYKPELQQTPLQGG